MVKFKLRLSMKAKLYLISSLSLLMAVCMLSGIWVRQIARQQRDNFDRLMQQMVEEKNAYFHYIMRDLEYLCATITTDRDVIGTFSQHTVGNDRAWMEQARKIDKMVTAVYGNSYYISSIIVGGENGHSYSVGTHLSVESIREEKWYQKLLQAGNQSVLIPCVMEEESHFFVGRAILSHGQPIGFVLVELSLYFLNSVFLTDESSDTPVFIVCNQEIAYRTDPQRETLFLEILAEGGESWKGPFNQRTAEGEYRVYRNESAGRWQMYSISPAGMYYSEGSELMVSIVLIACTVLLLALSGALLFSWRLARNISLLKQSVHLALSGGRAQSPICSGDEIEDISIGVNQAAASMKQLAETLSITETQKQLAEFQTLQSQINPHFLFNTLSTIQWMAQVQGSQNIYSLTNALIALLQSSVQAKELVTLAEELDYIEKYLEIQRYRYAGQFVYHTQVDPALEQMMIPRLILQPFVENALKHGIKYMKGQGSIFLKAYIREGDVVITVTDTGDGFDGGLSRTEVSQLSFSGIGIRNVDQRIKLQYGEEYGVSIESAQGLFTRVTVRLPLPEL